MTLALCVALIVLAVSGPLPEVRGPSIRAVTIFVVVYAVVWCVVMLAVAFALVVGARGWP